MSPGSSAPIHIVGGGLAGCEAAWQIVGQGVPVVLHEMRPLRGTAAHKTSGLAELVCSNSFRSDDPEHNAVGLLHEATIGSARPSAMAPAALAALIKAVPVPVRLRGVAPLATAISTASFWENITR